MTVKGEVHKDLADDFVGQFPIGTEVTLEEFDDWCVQRNLCPSVGSRDTTNPKYVAQGVVRNTIRNRINSGAACDLRSPQDRYQVTVRVHGESYSIAPLAEDASERYSKLPEKLRSFISQSVAKANFMYSHADRLQLTNEECLHLDYLKSNATMSLDRILYEITLLSKQNDQVIRQIEANVSNRQGILPAPEDPNE